MSDRITEIAGTITTDDGVTRNFRISPSGGIQQWGAPRESLGDTVEIVASIEDVLAHKIAYEQA